MRKFELKGRWRSIIRLIRTVRYLRPIQIYSRLWYRLYRPRPNEGPAPGIFPTTQSLVPLPARHSTLLGPRRFRFLNREGVVEGPEDWNAPALDKLWLYNLHYFDDLNAQGADQRSVWHRELIDRWVAENPPGRGNGWEPYPTSLRIVNWIKWSLAGNPLEPAWAQSLAVQARWLSKHIEWHLLGNHLFTNAKALVFAGLFFEGGEAAAWLERGLRILERQIPEQILADGGQFELSPMYHALAVEDLLDLINLTGACHAAVPQKWQGFVAQWPERVQKMRAWLSAMCHDDGEIALFNDAAFGVAPVLSELEAYATRLGLAAVNPPGSALVDLCESGYIRVQRGPALALLDVASIGPDYLPGHAHADTLSFELSVFGRRCVVNSGTSVYGAGPERLYQRSTSAHSTVEVEGENSSEVWSGFRVARRAYPKDVTIHESGVAISVSCSHDGYQRLPGKVTHRREWRISTQNLTIRDSLSGRFRQARARFYFHPDAALDAQGAQGTLTLPGGGRIRWRVGCGQARLVPSKYHPEFGVSVPNYCMEIVFTEPYCEVEFSWN